MDENGTYHYAGPSAAQPPKKPKKGIKNQAKIILVCVLAAILMLAAGTCFYTVDDKQQAVVTPVSISCCPLAFSRWKRWM